MKLLIITQKVDQDDPILGFFHRWIEEFANYCEKLTVICLAKGASTLPATVKVLSLGKERGVSRFHCLLNFYRYIWRERKNYDTVFIHMNQEYVLLGAPIWKLLGKKILLWRNHPRGSFLTRLAVSLADRVFCTSEHSFTARFSKTKIMPVGIDTAVFHRDPLIARKPNSVLFLGRIAPIKKPEILIEALRLLDDQGQNFTAVFVGDPLAKDDRYYQYLIDLTKKYGLQEKIKFSGGVPPSAVPAFYNNYEVFVNLTPAGSLDKTIFEAAACGALTVVANRSLMELKNIDEALICAEDDPQSLSDSLKHCFALDQKDKKIIGNRLRRYVQDHHGLNKTVSAVINSAIK